MNAEREGSPRLQELNFQKLDIKTLGQLDAQTFDEYKGYLIMDENRLKRALDMRSGKINEPFARQALAGKLEEF